MTIYYNGKKIAYVAGNYDISDTEAVLEYFELDSPNTISKSDQRIIRDLYEAGNSFVRVDDDGTYYIDWRGIESVTD